MLNNFRPKIYNLLHKSEKFFQTDMIYLAKGGFWLTFSKIIGSLTALGLAIAYSNLLDKNTYGLYKYVLSIAGILSITSLSGLQKSLTRSISLGFEGTTWKVIKTKFKYSTYGGLVGLIISAYYFYNHNITLGISFVVVAIFTTLINGLIIHGSVLAGKKMFKHSAIFNSINQVLVALSIITVLFLKQNIIMILISFYLSTFLIQGITSLIVYKKNKLNKKEDPKTINYGKHLSLMSVLGTFATHLDKIIIWHFLGPIQLAIYSFSILPIKQGKTFLSSINTIAFSKLTVQSPNATFKKSLLKKIITLASLLIIPVAAYILLAPHIYRLVFPEYLESIKYTQFFSLTILLFPFSMIASYFTAQAQKKPLYILNIISPIIKILLMVILIPLFGIWGAIISLLISNTTNHGINLYFLNKIKVN